MNTYSQLSIAELRALAKERKISGYSALRKQELIDALTASDNGSTSVEQKAPEAAAPAEKAAKSAKPAEAAGRTAEAPRPVVRRVVRSVQGSQAQQGQSGERSQERFQYQAGERRQERPQQAGERPQGQQFQGGAGRPADPTDSGIIRRGIFEICSDNYGFLRNDNYLPSEQDVYINPSMIRRYNLTTGDVVEGTLKVQTSSAEKFVPLHHITKINDKAPEYAMRRRRFDRLTPVFPHERLHLEYPGCEPSVRMVDMFSPIGKGQRGMIVSQPKAGKTTLLKQIARSILTNHKSVHMIILLIDERPEEVTDFKEFVQGTSAEVIYSTFDEEPNRHRRVSEMTMERAKRLVEYGEDVVILLDSITRLARAYNLTCVSSGRTLSGGLDPNALFMPKKFFGAARCMKEGGSLTILATALVDTGSRMDDVVYEEFKGTGNMELVLNRDLSERRIFPAIDLPKSSTRREDLLLNEMEQRANVIMRKAFNSKSADESVEQIINLFARTRTNFEFMQYLSRAKF
ncbi:MAG: transcription termination factor Rho [Lachnospiraceae bacterium]|nr:transcription termination factor Rho [Lachnospiraceae bacterium]